MPIPAHSAQEQEAALIDFILAGLTAGFFAFLVLFSLSFVTLGLTTGLVRLVAAAYRGLRGDRPTPYSEQTA